MRRLKSNLWLVIAWAILLPAAAVRADVLLDQTNLVGVPSVAAPSEYSFTASTAQALTLTLTDLQLPAAFSSLQVAVTLGDTLVGSATVNPATHTATLAIPAAAGNYTLDVIGTPNSTQGFGSFGVCVAPATSAASCVAAYSFSGNVQTPSSTSSTGTSTLNTNFTSTVAGSYTVTLTDDGFPVALGSLSAGIFQGSNPISVGIPAGTPTQVTLVAATSYQLLVAAIANSTLPAGLYGIQITDPTGAAVFTHTVPVGTLPAATIVDNTTAQALTLSLTDYGYPAALGTVGVAVTEGSASLATLTAPGTVANFTAPAGSVEIWQYAAAATQPGVYGVDLSVYAASTTGASLYSATQVVNPASITATSYAFVATLPSAGTYTLVANDFQFPSAFQSISATVAQNGTVLAQTSGGNFTAAQGPVVVLVNATPPQAGSGIFGVTVQTDGTSPQILLDQTQAVGAVFTTQPINLGNSGSYTVALDDLAFPQSFLNLAVVVSRGSQVLGKIYAGGTFQFTGIPGSQYVVSVVATPGSDNYGLYSLNIASAAPTVTFSASPTSVTAGDTTTLTWSSQNATSCTAGGSTAWTGSESTSGTLAVVVSATETLTLTCTGPGGSATQSLSVTATVAPASSGGGGGVDWGLLAMLGGLLLAGRRGARPGAAVTEL
jgi:plastocyanin